MRAYVQKASNWHIVGWLLGAGAAATLALVLAGQHTALVLLAAGFSLASSAVAWHQRDAERWVRMPLLSIPPIILTQVGLSLTPVQQHVPFLSSMVHPAICALPVAALLIPMIVLSVPNPSPTQRIGGGPASSSSSTSMRHCWRRSPHGSLWRAAASCVTACSACRSTPPEWCSSAAPYCT